MDQPLIASRKFKQLFFIVQRVGALRQSSFSPFEALPASVDRIVQMSLNFDPQVKIARRRGGAARWGVRQRVAGRCCHRQARRRHPPPWRFRQTLQRLGSLMNE